MPQTSEPKIPKKVRFQFQKPDDYKPIYVNGLYGGLTPRNDLLCHFFYEYRDIPEEETANVDPTGKMVEESLSIKRKGEPEENEAIYRRDVRVGIIVPIHQVESFAQWMLEKVEQAKKIAEIQDTVEKES